MADGASSSLDADVVEAVPDDEELDGSIPSNKHERSAMPNWLKTDYADTRERLVHEIKSNPSRMPTCYERNMFFDGAVSPFFRSHRKFQPTPEDFYLPCYFVWIPHLLAGRIPCPSCCSAGRKSTKGTTIFLQARGWPKAPRRVVDLDRCIFVIGHRYACIHPDCKKTYQSWSPSLLSALPRSVSMHFTHHLTYRGGITDNLAALLRDCFLHCMGPDPFANMIRTHHIRRYELLKLQYLELIYARLRSSGQLLLANFQPFSSFDDRDGFAGFSPSANYFRTFYVKFITAHAPVMDQYMGMLPARVLEIDHSFKVSEVISYVQVHVAYIFGRL